MEHETWPFVSEAIAKVECGERISEGYVTAAMERLEAALSSARRSDLDTTRHELERLVAAILRSAPEEVRAASRGSSPSDSLEFAYTLGQFSLAQELASYAFAKRVDDRFITRISDRRYERFVRALLSGALDGMQLASRLGLSKEHVSRVLRVLRSLEVVECRREGTRVVNRLTPNARAVADALRMGPLASDVDEERKRGRSQATLTLQSKRAELSGPLREVPTFDQKGRIADLAA